MEFARVLVSTSWQQRLQNEKYKNWLKVGDALSKTCHGIRSYIEREAKAFHAALTSALHGLPLCTCVHTPSRRPNPYHDMRVCSWAKELKKYHVKGRPTWEQNDASQWNDPNVGYWEVAKLFMPYGCGKGNSCAETDATGLLNLLYWCSHYKTDDTLVKRLKDTRNAWAHASTQEFDETETTDAFTAMKDFLQAAELIGDADAIDALNEITALENDDVIDFEDLETKVLNELKQYMNSMTEVLVEKIESVKDQEDIHANEIKEEILHVENMLIYCMKVGKERDDVLLNIQSVICNVQGQMDILLQSRINSTKEEDLMYKMVAKSMNAVKSLTLLVIILFLKLLKTIPRTVVLMVFLLSTATILDEKLDEIGCSAVVNTKDQLDLMEIDFTEYLNQAREGFVGRQWLFKEIDGSLYQEEHIGVLIIAAPGFGKSALISNLICSKLSSFSLHSQILGYHLCIHSRRNTQNGAVFVRNLANMIAGRLQDYESLIRSDHFIQKVLKHDQCSSDPTGCFEQGILTPLSRLRLRFLTQTMYIVVDALDECFNENKGEKETSIVDILSNNIKMFPKWLKVIITSRNVTNIRRKFSSFDVFDCHPDDPRNLQDIERFILSKLHQYHSFFSRMKSYFVEDSSIQAMVNKSQGNFLYIKLILKYLKNKGVSEASWNSLPTSINSIYQEFFERKFNTKEKFKGPRKIFEILVATRTPLTTEELYEVLLTKHKNPEDFHFEYDFMFELEELSMYLSSIQENQIVTVFHNSLTEWLTSKSNKGGRFYVDPKEGNRMLADYYFKKIYDKSVNITPQFICNLATYVVKGSSIKRHVDDFRNLDPRLIRVTDINTNLTALHIAAGEENEEITGLLLHAFKNAVDIEDHNGRTPAFYAVRFGRLANLHLLHQSGASLIHLPSKLACGNPNNEEDLQYCERQMSGYSLLHVACKTGHQQIAEFLLANNVSVSTLSESGTNALHLASKYNHSEIAKSLMKHGAVPDNRCLYYATLHGNPVAVRLFLEKGAEDTCMGCTKISSAYSRGQFHFQNHDDRHNYRQQCNTALHVAAINNYLSVAKLLLKSKKNAVHCTNYYGKDPLLEAVEKNRFKIAKLLLKSGANPSSFCKSYSQFVSPPCPCGHTPLHLVAHYGFVSMTKLLLKYNADYNATGCEDLQPIHVAACHGQVDILSILVRQGADVNSKGPNNMTPMHYACKCQADGIFDKLFELGANGTALTLDGNTPLYYIIQQHSIDENFALMDPYVSNPIDPINYENCKNVTENSFEQKYPWMISMIKYLVSFTKEKSYELNSLFRLSLDTIFVDIIANVSKSVLGSLQPSNWRFAALTSTLFYAYDIGVSSDFQKHVDMLGSFSVFKKAIFKALVYDITDCSFLINMVEMNLVYFFDILSKMGHDINCQDSYETSSPLLAYLRQGGRNMAKVLVKHRVRVDIQCGEYFEDSVFHLAAYHKLHYLQYISVFLDPVQWEEYLKKENAFFDYLFDEYDWRTVNGQSKVVRVRDGPVTKAIKSHPRRYKIIDECLDDEGYTVLHRAAQGGNVVAVKHFLNWEANLTIKNQDGLDPLVLSIWYAVKYRPYFNFHKPSLSTSLEIEFASLTAITILRHLTRDKPFNVGCDDTKKAPTLLHLAATRGMWRFINELFLARENIKVTGLTANCPTKDNITPMYLARLHGGDDCDWDNPWCKVVGILLKHGASMIYPDPLTEYLLFFNFLFHELPGRLDLGLNKEELGILIKGDSEGCSDLQDYLLAKFRGNQYYLQSEKWKSMFCFDIDGEFNLCKIFAGIPLFVAEAKFGCTKSSFNDFLRKELENVKSGFSYLKNVDDATLRCVTPTNRHKPREITDESDPRHQIFKSLRSIMDIAENIQSGVFTEHDERIHFPPSFFDLKDLDMCSSKATITFDVIEEYLGKNYRVYLNYYKKLNKNIRLVIPAIRRCKYQYNLKTHYADTVINKALRYYERPMSCRLKETTFKYTELKFLLHTIKFWNTQVQKMSFYPSISKFVSERIQDVLLSDHTKRMVSLILRLTDEDCLSNYKYLEMLRFSKPPMFDRTIKYDM